MKLAILERNPNVTPCEQQLHDKTGRKTVDGNKLERLLLLVSIGRDTGPVFREGITEAGSVLAESRAEETQLGPVLPKQHNARLPGVSNWLPAFCRRRRRAFLWPNMLSSDRRAGIYTRQYIMAAPSNI